MSSTRVPRQTTAIDMASSSWGYCDTPPYAKSAADAVAGHKLADAPRNRDRKPAPNALYQPLVLREQLEQRLHRSPTEWPSQLFQASHGVAGPVEQQCLDETTSRARRRSKLQ